MRSTFERRERDLNPRVQGTVDFESTAIPGYAISACLLPVRHRHKRDASQGTSCTSPSMDETTTVRLRWMTVRPSVRRSKQQESSLQLLLSVSKIEFCHTAQS